MEHFWNFLLNLVFVRTCWLIKSETAGMHQFQQFLGWKCWLKRGRQSDQAPTPPSAGAVTWHWPGRTWTQLFLDRVWLLGVLHKHWKLMVSSQHRANSTTARCYRGWENSFPPYTIWRSALCVLGLFSNYSIIPALFSFSFKCKSRLDLFSGFCYD